MSKHQTKVQNALDARVASWAASVKTMPDSLKAGYHKPGSLNQHKTGYTKGR